MSGLPVKAGTVIDGKYRVEGLLGEGGMGAVVRATHTVLGHPVAIKLIRSQTAQTEEARLRFVREAQAAAQLKSDHVGRVYDVGALPDGVPYLVMEHLEGHDLLDQLTDWGAAEPMVAVRYIVEALDAIAEAHRLGIIHRDLKPANLFLSRQKGDVRIKVLDFGISKLVGERVQGAGALTTDPTTVLGSPAYMSPEQVRSAKLVDARTDVWALGVILHELLSGQNLFAGETVGEVIANVLTMVPPRLPPHVGAPLQAIVDRCLDRDPARRYEDGYALLQAL
ncbi:MAG: serine/threonine-protein kinase, partial [Myxococcota bacterium]